MHSSCAAALLAPWARLADAAAAAVDGATTSGAGLIPAPEGQSPGLGSGNEIVLGTSAAFTGPSRGLGNELYRGAMAYFSQVNESGGIGGRPIALKLYDDGYQPDPCVQNTLKLMLEDQVFLLFGYVGTPTVTRVLPMLKKFQEQQIYMFFPFTGAQPQREPPYGDFAFNLRASYRQETAGLDGQRGQFVHASNHVSDGVDMRNVCLLVDHRNISPEIWGTEYGVWSMGVWSMGV